MSYTDIYWICLFYDTVYFWICYILFYYYFFCILTSIPLRVSMFVNKETTYLLTYFSHRPNCMTYARQRSCRRFEEQAEWEQERVVV